MKPFLTAEWRKLILLTYAVDSDVLKPYLPPGLSLDMRGDRAFVSFVAFDFLNTRLLGLPIPFHINFPEINLRFYVKHKERRGVCFIKELVPKRAIAEVARRVYNEPYEYCNMQSKTQFKEGRWEVEHQFYYGKRSHEVRFIADNEPYFPPENSSEYFFKEHEWGFGLTHKGKLMEYRVEHPVWQVYPLRTRFHLDIDFGLIYGANWAFLNGKIPYNVMMAEGSPITVFKGKLVS